MLVPLINATFTGRLTPRPPCETTRKLSLVCSDTPIPQLDGDERRACKLPLLAAAALGLSAAFHGCATPGPLHVYTVATAQPAEHISDFRDGQTAEVPSFIENDERVIAFAYDPFTDHFFLRLVPGNVIRVVDRPAREIKREFTVEGLGAGGDLAARPRDGHLFFLEQNPVRVIETTRLGKRLGSFTLESVTSAQGIAIDPARNRLAVLHGDGRQVSFHTLDGRQVESHPLERRVGPSLALDAEQAELYAPLTETRRLGVFSFQGRLLRELPVTATFVDVGPRSFVRVF